MYPACNAHAPYCHLWPAPLCSIFSMLSHKQHDFGRKKKVTEHKICVLIFSTNFPWNIFILRRTRRDRSKMYVGLHVHCPLCLSDFNEIWIFSIDFSKSTHKIQWKSVQWEPNFIMRTDGQTDITKLTVAFRNFAKAPTNLHRSQLNPETWGHVERNETYNRHVKCEASEELAECMSYVFGNSLYLGSESRKTGSWKQANITKVT
jgi:hypothetical protein